jgi:hypothetical protein
LAFIKSGVRSNGGTDLYGAGAGAGGFGCAPSSTFIYGGIFCAGWDNPEGLHDPDGNVWTAALVSGAQVILKLDSVTDATVSIRVTQAGLVYAIERIAGPTIPAGALIEKLQQPATLGMAAGII